MVAHRCEASESVGRGSIVDLMTHVLHASARLHICVWLSCCRAHAVAVALVTRVHPDVTVRRRRRRLIRILPRVIVLLNRIGMPGHRRSVRGGLLLAVASAPTVVTVIIAAVRTLTLDRFLVILHGGAPEAGVNKERPTRWPPSLRCRRCPTSRESPQEVGGLISILLFKGASEM